MPKRAKRTANKTANAAQLSTPEPNQTSLTNKFNFKMSSDARKNSTLHEQTETSDSESQHSEAMTPILEFRTSSPT